MKIFSNCKKGVLILVAVILIVGAGVGSTAAYFRHAQTVNNVLSVGENTIEIAEDYAPPKEMQPGENEYKKKVTVKNTGTVPCYVRVYAGFSDSAVENVSQLYNQNGWFDATSYPDNLPNGWAFVTPADDAVVGDSGYYYYTEPLQPGKSTAPLFEKVKTTFAKAEDVQDYEIFVYAESVQTRDKDGMEFSGAEPWKDAWTEFLERKTPGSSVTELTGLTVTYKGPDTIESTTEDTYTFTADDLEAIASYDDGTTATIPFDQLELDPASVTGNQNTSGAGFTVNVSYTEDGMTVSDSFSVEVHLQIPVVPHTITYDANGGYFGDQSVTVNPVTYEWKTETIPYTEKISKTANVSEAGSSFSGGYGNNQSLTDTITIPGAETLHVKITYQTESTRYDWVALYDKNTTPTSSNYNNSISKKLGGTTKTTKEFDITGDTVQIYFRSDSSGCDYFGYYAIVSANVPTTIEHNSIVSGAIKEPNHQENLFLGWYTDSACTDGHEYVFDESTELTEDITVYAKWKVPTAMFDTGKNVNIKMKKLSSQSSATYNTLNTTITSIQKANVMPELTTMLADNMVSTTTSDVPIYMWFDKGIIYWWSKAKNVYLNQDSSYMFFGYEALTNLNVSSFDTSQVTNMSWMFSSCKALSNLDLRNFDTSQATNMSAMFAYCEALTNLNLSSLFNTSQVTRMDSMFSDCSALTNLDLSSFNTSKVTNMESIFYDCYALTNLDLRGFNTSKVTNMRYMFCGCKALTTIKYGSNFTNAAHPNTASMFSYCPANTPAWYQ